MEKRVQVKAILRSQIGSNVLMHLKLCNTQAKHIHHTTPSNSYPKFGIQKDATAVASRMVPVTSVGISTSTRLGAERALK